MRAASSALKCVILLLSQEVYPVGAFPYFLSMKPVGVSLLPLDNPSQVNFCFLESIILLLLFQSNQSPSKKPSNNTHRSDATALNYRELISVLSVGFFLTQRKVINGKLFMWGFVSTI